MGRSAARFQHSAVHEHRLRLIGDHVRRRAALDLAKACARAGIDNATARMPFSPKVAGKLASGVKPKPGISSCAL